MIIGVFENDEQRYTDDVVVMTSSKEMEYRSPLLEREKEGEACRRANRTMNGASQQKVNRITVAG